MTRALVRRISKDSDGMNHVDDQPSKDKDPVADTPTDALEAEEMLFVAEHLAQIAESPVELQELQEVVALLPYVVPPVEPPLRVRRQLLARIAASQSETKAPVPTARPARRSAWSFGWRSLMLAFVLALILTLSAVIWSQHLRLAELAQINTQLQSELAQARADLAQVQRALADMNTEQRAIEAQLQETLQEVTTLRQLFSEERFVFTFVTAPGVATRKLIAVDSTINADGAMYMRPGQREAVVLFRGLQPLPPGMVYRFWLANGQQHIAVGTVTVESDGLARLTITAPDAVNRFSQVMLTLESASGGADPDRKVILEGSL